MAIGHGIYSSLMRQREECQDHEFADIHDGDMHRAMKLENGQSSDCVSISLTLNTDGALLYQSTSCSMWPVLLMINELPFSARFS